MAAGGDWIDIVGARTHNLRGDPIRIPIGKVTAITGVSGSGKSSLAFDTLYVEGQCRFLECLSPGARRWLDRLPRPLVDSIANLPPTLSVEQSAPRANPRATVATATEVHDLLRLLFARFGTALCNRCGAAVGTQTFDELVTRTADLQEGTRILILAPIARGHVGDLKEHWQRIRRDGFLRARLDGEPVLAENPPVVDPNVPHDLDLVVDRQVIKPGIRDRLAESIATALKQGQGAAAIARELDGRWIDEPFAGRGVCMKCGQRVEELDANALNFNSPAGACPCCQGFGSTDEAVCAACAGSRLRAHAKSLVLCGQWIGSVCRLCVDEANEWVQSLRAAAGPFGTRTEMAEPIVTELARRLDFLRRVGIGYLELDRPLMTLSGGEAQRTRLAGCVAAGSVGVLYVLDEPTAGLHARDVDRLWRLVEELRDRGNTIVVVEHDRTFVERADWVVDFGPGAGSLGGSVVFEAPADSIASQPGLTADYLVGRRMVASARPRRATIDGSTALALRLANVDIRNLNIAAVTIPLGQVVCLSGVSGSGKSTLVQEALLPAVCHALGLTARRPTGVGELLGYECLARVIEVDQRPIADSVRSTPATATGAMDHLRKLYAQTKVAKLRGFGAGRFSFNNKAGQCATCKGLGRIAVDNVFLPDAFVQCDECGGARFNAATLTAVFRDRTIADVLAMTVTEAAALFENQAKLARILRTLDEVGLGYLRLGQPGDTLSGGEAQRLKLAAELAKATDETAFSGLGATLFVLDEPTTGLHFDDIRRLLSLLNRLCDAGQSLLIVEHHLDVLAAADWIIDLGPEGGAGGGRIVAQGRPRDIAAAGTATGAALRNHGIAW